ncbi:MAG: serine hydrolase [Acidimicrobiales bacterium]
MIAATNEVSNRPTQHRDGFLDAVKAIALWRVVLWHALAWPWLSWFAAMPAMFYVAGVLLQQSLDKHGYLATLRARVSRLLVPFWLFGLVAATVMVWSGWRPRLVDALWWIVPIGDPVGSSTMPGLWIPLWYLRAYLWVVIAGAALSWACRRFGLRVLSVPVAATLGVWAWQAAGNEVPLAVADAALFPFFVMAGMLTAMGRLELVPRRAVPIGALAAGLAVLWYLIDGAPMGVVNGSLPVHLLVGVATIGLLTGIRGPLSSPGRLPRRFIGWSSSRALTIYLWHGFGLVVAERVVHRHDVFAPVASALGLVVVVLVTLAAAAVLGSVEDRAARRPTRSAPVGVRLAVAPAAVVIGLALVSGDLDPDRVRLVPSGEAVQARAEEAEVVAGDLDELAARGSTAPGALDEDALNQAFERWVDENDSLLADLDTELVEVALVDGDDEDVLLQWTRDGREEAIEPFPWWSMSKTMTVAWMMQLADQGVISLDAPLDDYLATVPHADEMTFEQLAGHRAGLPSELDGELVEATPIDEIGAYFESPDLAHEPGEQYEYSRVGYYLLTWGLEEASGSRWRDAMESIASDAGVDVLIDEDLMSPGPVTHPGDGEYRGALWGAGGLHGTTVDGARLFRWTLMDALDEETVRQMATTDADDDGYYGLGLAPNCPCVTEDGELSSDRVGLSTITGTYVVDLSSDVGLMLRTDNWWSEAGPALEFDDLVRDLLETTSQSPAGASRH